MAHNGKHVWVCRTAQASYWQVGESSEQNGCFKMMLTKYKRKLLQCKELAGVKFAIKKEDITYIVSQAWLAPYAEGGLVSGGGGDQDNDTEDVMISADGLQHVVYSILSKGLAGSLIDTIIET